MKALLKTVLFIAGLTFLTSFTETFPGEAPKTILFIPYQPKMYLSDADGDISDYSGVPIRQVRVLLRNSLIEKLFFKLRETFYVKQLSEYGKDKDLDRFYDSENFYLSSRDTSHKEPVSASANPENPYFGIFKEKSSPDYASSYMNVSLSKPVLFKELATAYEADYFVVLTQLEIKTHYNECIDIANRNFRREFLVHFAVFDSDGNQTGGNAVSFDAGPDVNSINKISDTVFPELAEKISAHVAAATLKK